MREILFRGKSIETGEWVYGDLFNNHDERKFIGELVITDYTGNACDQYELGIGFCEVIPETVGQFTGLVDRYRKKIFEGDVLDSPRWIVSYLGNLNDGLGLNAAWYVQRDGFESYSELECEEYHKVLGNIHDNPELLERKRVKE